MPVLVRFSPVPDSTRRLSTAASPVGCRGSSFRFSRGSSGSSMHPQEQFASRSRGARPRFRGFLPLPVGALRVRISPGARRPGSPGFRPPWGLPFPGLRTSRPPRFRRVPLPVYGFREGPRRSSPRVRLLSQGFPSDRRSVLLSGTSGQAPVLGVLPCTPEFQRTGKSVLLSRGSPCPFEVPVLVPQPLGYPKDRGYPMEE